MATVWTWTPSKLSCTISVGRMCGPNLSIQFLPSTTQLVSRYCADGRLDTHIQELIALYRHKRNVMLEAIAREFPTQVTTLRPEGGFFIWCRLPAGMSAAALLKAAEERGATF